MKRLSPVSRARFLLWCDPGVPLRSTPGFMLSPRFAGLSLQTQLANVAVATEYRSTFSRMTR